jgi:hypothetical protein
MAVVLAGLRSNRRISFAVASCNAGQASQWSAGMHVINLDEKLTLVLRCAANGLCIREHCFMAIVNVVASANAVFDSVCSGCHPEYTCVPQSVNRTCNRACTECHVTSSLVITSSQSCQCICTFASCISDLIAYCIQGG